MTISTDRPLEPVKSRDAVISPDHPIEVVISALARTPNRR